MVLAALATVDDVVALLGRALTTEENGRIDGLLRSASAKIRSATCQQITAGESTARRRVLHGKVRLPQKPVTEVASVTRASDALALEFFWPGQQHVQTWLWRIDDFHNVPGLRRELDVVDVTYSHGYDVVPEDIVAVTVNVVLRSLGIPATEGGITQEAIQGYSYRRGVVGAAGALGLLPDELDVLKPYSAGSRVGTVRLT